MMASFKIHPLHPTATAAEPQLLPRPRRRRRIRAGSVLAIALAAGGAAIIAGPHFGSSHPSAPAAPPAAKATPHVAKHEGVYISPQRQQLIGVRSAPVARQRVGGTLRTVGTLAYDETRTVQIHTRVAGWLEQLYVDYIGKPVKRGQTLFAIYSPDVATAQADYLVALRATAGEALVQASRERLRRLNVSDAQIAELETTGRPSRTIAITSPFDGVVVAKAAFAGQYVTPETTAFTLADPTTIWAIGQVFEHEATRLHVGDAVCVEFPYGQASQRHAKIDFIYPDVDPQTRRVRFRITLDNHDRTLKPDTYVTILWHGDATDRLVLPGEAVIDAGPRKYVLLALAGGYFAPRDVQVGPAAGDVYPVVSGVAEGDRVVTSAQFLIDSETNLMSAMQGMSMAMPGMDDPQQPDQQSEHADHNMPGM